MSKLMEGVVYFREQILPKYMQRFRKLAFSQTPDTLFIACSDSRVTPNLVTSTLPGDLFVMRNVGNLIPPAAVDGVSSGDLSEASAIEYAVLVLKVSEIIICGHSACGAMKAITGDGGCPDASNLNQWLEHARPAARRMEQEAKQLEQKGAGARLKPYDRVSQLNVLVQLEHLASYPIVRERVAAGTLRLHGWWFDIASASMLAYNSADDRFEPIDRRMVKRRVARRLAAARGAMTSPDFRRRSGETVGRSGTSNA